MAVPTLKSVHWEQGHVYQPHAIRFNPVFKTRDFASYIHESMPLNVPEQMDLKKSIMDY